MLKRDYSLAPALFKNQPPASSSGCLYPTGGLKDLAFFKGIIFLLFLFGVFGFSVNGLVNTSLALR